MLKEYIEDNNIKEVLLTLEIGDIDIYAIVKREDLRKFSKLEIARYIVDVTEYVLE